MFLVQSLISWKCKRQNTGSKLSVEAESRSVSPVTSEVVWLRRLLYEHGVFLPQPTPLYVVHLKKKQREKIYFMLIMPMPFRLKIILSSMKEPRTLKLIVISFASMFFLVSQIFHISSQNQLADLFTRVLLGRVMISSPPNFCFVQSPHQFEGECKSVWTTMVGPMPKGVRNHVCVLKIWVDPPTNYSDCVLVV